jgi:hypothetical protein
MTGVRVNTTGSTNLTFDVYATAESSGKVRILAGSEVHTGTWSINVVNLSAVGFPSCCMASSHKCSCKRSFTIRTINPHSVAHGYFLIEHMYTIDRWPIVMHVDSHLVVIWIGD